MVALRQPQRLFLFLTLNGICTALMIAGTIWHSRLHWMHELGLLSEIGISAIASVPAYRYVLKRFLPTYGKLERICLHVGIPCPINPGTTKLLTRAVVASLLLWACSEIAFLSVGGSKGTLFGSASVIFESVFVGGAFFLLRHLKGTQEKATAILDDLESGRAHQESTHPPRSAKFLLLLIPRPNREHLIGDLEEEYAQIVLPEFGPRKARLWYWWQVLASLTPLLWAEIKRLAGWVLVWKSVR